MKKSIKNKKNNGKSNKKKWTVLISIWTFFLTIGFNIVSEIFLNNSNIFISFIILLLIILIGVFFDMIGIAVASADLTPFNSMAANRVNGSKEAVRIVKNASQVSNFCNDVIGDICGIISGATSITIIFLLVSKYSLMDISIVTVVLNGFVAALTVGGKAIGKNIALENKTEIVYRFAYVVYKLKLIKNK